MIQFECLQMMPGSWCARLLKIVPNPNLVVPGKLTAYTLAWWKVVSYEVVGDVPLQNHFEAGDAEVAKLPIIQNEVLRRQVDHVHWVVQHDGVGSLYIPTEKYMNNMI